MTRRARAAWLRLAAMAVLMAPAGVPAHADDIILPPGLSRTAPARFLYRLSAPATGRGRLEIEWTDADHHLIERQSMDLDLKGQAEIAFTLDLRRATVTANGLHTELDLRSGTPPVQRQVKTDTTFALPPVEQGWADYQLIMWQPHDEQQNRALRRLGITAGEIHGYHETKPPQFFARQMAPLIASGLGWYVENIATDFYSAYHRWFPDRPVNWRFAAVKRLYWQDPNDPAAYRREPSLSDPAWLQKISLRLADTVAAQRQYRPLFYNLADEPGIAELSVAWDFDFSPPSLAGMRAWLEAQYGTIVALDREWDARFSRWSEVVPMTTRLAMLRRDGNFSAWGDFKAWMDVAFAAAVAHGTAAVHQADPEARAGLEGAQVSGWGGYDYSRLAAAVDVMEVYDDGENLAAAQSFNPRLILLTTAAGGGAQEIHTAWRELLRGTRGLILWDPDNSIAGRPGPRGAAEAATFAEFRHGLGALLINAPRRLDPVAIVYSPASLRTQWLLDWLPKGDGWSDRDTNADYEDPNEVRSAMIDDLRSLDHAGVTPRFLSDRAVARGALGQGERLLILPRSIALSLAAAEEIRRFVAAGGTVVAQGEPGLYDQHSRRLLRPSLADLFAAPLATGRAVKAYGKGRAIALPPGVGSAALPAILAAAGVAPPFRLMRLDGTAASDVEAHLWQDGGVTILALQRDFSDSVAAPAEALTLELARPAYAYDLRRKLPLGQSRRLTLSLDAVAPLILALSDAPLPGLAITVPQTMRLGETGELRLHLRRVPVAARQVFHLAVFDPAGRPVPDYSGNIVTTDGSGLWRLPLALNDPPGEWRILATNILNGAEASGTIKVSGD